MSDAIHWVERLEDAPADLSRAVVWLVAPELAEAAAARPTPEDLADAASLGPERGAARLLRQRLLRALAGQVLACAPGEVRFERSREGRVGVIAPRPAFASVAGRDGWAAVGVGPRPLGVDVEVANPAPPLPLDLLPPETRARLAGLPPEAQARAFAHVWTAAEAWAKASGAPLEAALRSGPGSPVTIREFNGMIAAAVELR